MILLVTGGRAYHNQRRIFEALDELDREEPITLLIQGGAEGADKHARLWACANQRPCVTFHAHWASLGKAAGVLRNDWMLEYGKPTHVAAFPGGRGTAHMKTAAEKAGVPVRTFE